MKKIDGKYDYNHIVVGTEVKKRLDVLRADKAFKTFDETIMFLLVKNEMKGE